jgi:hypothetical protein
MLVYILILIVALAIYFLFPGIWDILDFIPRTLESIGFLLVGFVAIGMVIMLLIDKIKNRKG